MKTPFSFSCKSRGLPDSTVHHGGYNQQQQTNNVNNAVVPASQVAIIPAGYPTDGNTGGYSYNNNYSPVVEPPAAYPYAAQPEKEAEAAWEFNAGNNMNKKGNQKKGHIKVGNTTNGSGLPINLPQNGRFVFNAGGNTNEGDMQEGGNIEFANIRA